MRQPYEGYVNLHFEQQYVVILESKFNWLYKYYIQAVDIGLNEVYN
jgi:hypothetical protein